MNENLFQELRAIRKKAGLSLEEAAYKCGVSTDYIFKLEHGSYARGFFQRLHAVCTLYKISPHRLIRALWFDATGTKLVLKGGTTSLTKGV